MFNPKMSSLLSVLGLLTCPVVAWGPSGHQAVGYVAMQFLSDRSAEYVKNTLGPAYSGNLGIAATWADDVRRQPEYRWSGPLHYVDTEDSPPTACHVLSEDCGDGCILSAISNYTTRVVDQTLPVYQRHEALKFLIHVRLLEQSSKVNLFTLKVSKGAANDIPTKCSGRQMNLHSVWDDGMIEKMLQNQYNSSVKAWANALGHRVKTGEYNATVWLDCASPFAQDATGKERSCPLVWAQESNALDCSFVWSYTSFSDLCTITDINGGGDSPYYTTAIPIIETQIAKQGVRFAEWLDVIVDVAMNGASDYPSVAQIPLSL
ncbi:hypothetical protein VNI00_012137 [Paramarasmius palmivorus]|uniref:Uncharacterized protein n=1 Tax=Paramarasmius palmivorus TaxID=297713 RepID=A0AAW0C7W1_9AGAR